MTMPTGIWARQARIIRAKDGDTLVVIADNGDGRRYKDALRLYGCDTPETFRPRSGFTDLERQAGKVATAFVMAWVEAGQTSDEKFPFIIETHKTGSRGRILTKVWRRIDERELSHDLLEAGLAREHLTSARLPEWTEAELTAIANSNAQPAAI